MGGTMNVEPYQTCAVSSFLEEMIHHRRSHTFCSGSLDVEINEVQFHLAAKGDSAVISFDRLSDAPKVLCTILPDAKYRAKSIEMFDNLLNKIGLTIYIRNHHFGVLGPKANPVYRKLISFIGSLV